jgi:hypothetical protein
MRSPDNMIDVNHPTMLSSCARAATAAEARYRVQYPNSVTRTSRIFALDPAAAEAMYAITEQPWNDAHFLTLATQKSVEADQMTAADLPLCHPDGSLANLVDEIAQADVVVLLATEGTGEGAAEVIARECYARNIMCAGIALGAGNPQASVNRVVNSMRRFARVLVVADDADYLPAMLTALRA